MKPKDDNKNVIRLNEEGNNDDIVISDIDCFRLEQMNNNSWWLACYRGDKRISFNLVATANGVECWTQEDELKIPVIELK